MQTDKVRQEFSEDMSIRRAFSIVFDRRPDLRYDELVVPEIVLLLQVCSFYTELLKLVYEYRLEGLGHKVLQWYLCRMEGWFAADADTISLKCWDQASFRSITKLKL